MILEQFYLGCLAQASYLIGDEETKTAVVVDPRRDVDDYLAAAEREGLTIKHVILTHCHADFLAGHLELRERCGATIHLGAQAQAEFPFEPLSDRDRLEFGQVRLVALETPGHTPESISILVYDLARSEEAPHAVLTGDTLFIGDVGRPDLLASVGLTAQQLAEKLFASLHEKLLPLPDATLLYPGHGAGSMCGKNLSSDTVSTIGDQRANNYALQPMSKEAFVAEITADQPEAPAYFAYDAQLNKQERATLEASLAESLKPLDLEAFLAQQEAGAQVVDARSSEAFAAGHLKGSLNIGLGGKYATWAGTILDPNVPILIVAEPGKEQEAVMRLGRIGFDRVAGYLEGGASAFADRSELQATQRRVEPAEVKQALESDAPPVILDIRSCGERASSPVEGSLNVPLNQLARRMGEVPRDRELAVLCRSGYRSSIACSMLAQEGVEAANIVGGILAWT